MNQPDRAGIDALLNRYTPANPGILPPPGRRGPSPAGQPTAGMAYLASADFSTAGDGVAVNRAALPAEARVWDQQSDTMGTITAQIRNAAVTISDPGIFTEVVSAYNGASAQVGAWTAGGQQTMASIAAALRRAAQTYDDTESQITGAIQDIYREQAF